MHKEGVSEIAGVCGSGWGGGHATHSLAVAVGALYDFKKFNWVNQTIRIMIEQLHGFVGNRGMVYFFHFGLSGWFLSGLFSAFLVFD
jgi:hypothetical protein